MSSQASASTRVPSAIAVPARPAAFIPLLPYQREDVESPARLRWCCWSRQSGKSFTKSLRRILRGIERGRNQIFLSAGERQSYELMQKARQHCQALKLAADYFDDRFFAGTRFKRLEILLPNRVRILGLPANPMTARGFTGDVLLDEFAMHADDREIWAAMFPTLLRGQGELDVCSTPKGIKNVFAQLRDNEQFSHSVVTLPDAIAQGLEVDYEQVRRAMGDEQLFRQEFLCEFLDEATAFLTYAMIACCEDPTLNREPDLEALKEHRGDLAVGIDLGRRRDLTVIWIVAVEGRHRITRGLVEMQDVTFREQYARIAELLRLPAVRRCCIDAGGLGMQIAEAAAEDFGTHRVEACTFTPLMKQELAGGLRLAVEEACIRIPVDEAIRNDWHSVERTVSTGGQERYRASRAEGSHADRFWAAALALRAAGSHAGRAEMLTTSALRFARTGAW
ncbi:MAG: terminase family protein [Planctomycetota bacterium]